MRTGQDRARQVQQAIFILKDQAAIFLGRVPVLAMNQKRRTQAGGPCLDHREALWRLRANHAGHAAFQNTRLFARDFGQRFAKVLLMVDRDRGDNRQLRLVDDVGGIKPAAKADL
ncbi:hypothetical protein GALL_540360 [mine drainage metagenome]|uniref:Uncharacterized protein n=1 Tax=mine drainage metagenome TaxID=410659 RepID=A0A1J5PAA8_9ZZZZ